MGRVVALEVGTRPGHVPLTMKCVNKRNANSTKSGRATCATVSQSGHYYAVVSRTHCHSPNDQAYVFLIAVFSLSQERFLRCYPYR